METINVERIFDKRVLIMKRWLQMQMLKAGICFNPLTEANSHSPCALNKPLLTLLCSRELD